VDANDSKAAELAEIVRQIRERVRISASDADPTGVALPDLTPLLQARDAALGKVASIGTVNPRAGGLVNNAIQSVKRLIARSLNWHVREQVNFNRAILRCAEATLEVHGEMNRAVASLGRRLQAHEQQNRALQQWGADWEKWRHTWEARLAAAELSNARTASETQTAFQQRFSEANAALRDLLAAHRREAEAALTAQHRAFEKSLDGSGQQFHQSLEKATIEIQERLWKDLRKIQFDYESLIHRELRVLRQRAVPSGQATGASPNPLAELKPPALDLDWLQFAERFRGSFESIKRSFERYVPLFRECSSVLDLGCGRGEFLELMREGGVSARGIDLNEESVSRCRNNGLNAEQADIFQYLAALPDQSVGGIFCAQVIEHLQPAQVLTLVQLSARKLQRGAPIVFETPNPECLAIFATHFYIDPTHVRPVPPALMAFYLEEAGLAQIEVSRFSPAVETMPSLEKLPAEFRQEFFDGLDYSISARRVL